jgi:hypothetical protein
MTPKKPEKEEETAPPPLKPVELLDLQTQNPMIEIAFNDDDYTVVFIKDIVKVETLTEMKDYRTYHRLIIAYRDGKHTTWTWGDKAVRDTSYRKVMAVMRACYPILKT